LTAWPESTRVDRVLEKVPDPSEPAEALAAVVSLRRLADRLEAASVQAAVDQGWNWVQIADALGVTKQAVHKKYARRVRRRPA
jgi:DNA-directed RNA polymerase specialized sigma24 family protein